MQVKRSRMLLAAALVAVASACDDSTGLGPTLENRETSHVVYAMNGTAQTLSPTSIRAGRSTSPSISTRRASS
jgi:hypothetical protein